MMAESTTTETTEHPAGHEAAGFPPFAHMAMLRAEAKQADIAEAFLRAARQVLRDTGSDVELHGPLPAPMPRRSPA